MEKKYPRFRMYKRGGLWCVVLMKDPVHTAGAPRKYVYDFDARTAIDRALGKPVKYTMTFR